jgi:hypothetical protein
MQAGLRPRVVAHLVARLSPPSSHVEDENLPRWAYEVLTALDNPEFLEQVRLTQPEREVLTAAGHVRSMLLR